MGSYYDGKNYPGEITSCDDDMEVNVMHRSGEYWKWPNNENKICSSCNSSREKIIMYECNHFSGLCFEM